MPAVYLGIGSNIEPRRNLVLALADLERRFGELRRSSVYRSRAYGFDGDDFLNMVVTLESGLTPAEIHEQLEQIQRAAGRDEAARGYSSRTLDIDLLLYGDLVMNEGPIRLPRTDVLRFSFVLGPLAELAPDLLHPGTDRSYRDYWREFDVGDYPITREELIL